MIFYDTIWDRVLEHTQNAPNDTAVRSAAGRLTYSELADRATTLARILIERSDEGSLVALQLSDAAQASVAILAAAVARRAFTPLSIDSPPAHRAHVVQDAGPQLLVSHSDDDGFVIAPFEEEEVEEFASGMTDIAYVMYTSGSTGRPKGVVASHRTLLERLDGLAKLPGLRSGESILAMTALSFDPSMAELLLPLHVGGVVVAAPGGAKREPSLFAETVAATRPDVLQATPSFWRLALTWGWEGCISSRIWCGGEPLTPALAEPLLGRCAELWNVYGPTETTIWTTADLVTDSSRISVGRPLPGSGLFLADAEGEIITAPGLPGEIMLHGAGLADGYLKQPALTAERFSPTSTPEGRKVCYRTGDRGQYREDSTIEFLGRTDAQIKLRGHRIELGEIEAVLELHPGVTQAVVTVRHANTPERASLTAFIVATANTSSADVRRWLAARLPPIMRPARIVPLDTLPRTTGGKVDRVRLAQEVTGV